MNFLLKTFLYSTGMPLLDCITEGEYYKENWKKLLIKNADVAFKSTFEAIFAPYKL
jgi:hypothetical protein